MCFLVSAVCLIFLASAVCASIVSEHGNDVLTRTIYGNVISNPHEDYDTIALRVFAAAEAKNTDMVRHFEEFQFNVHAENYLGQTLLHIACKIGDPETAAVLLFHGARVDVRDRQGHTPVHFAACNSLEMLETILAHPGASSVINVVNGSNSTPLHLAARNGNEQIIALLLRNHADINALDSVKCTPLHLAAEVNNPAVVELLLSMQANVNARDGYDDTPLHYAVENGCTDVVAVLLNHGANIFAVAFPFTTPLQVAAYEGFPDCAALLLKAFYLRSNLSGTSWPGLQWILNTQKYFFITVTDLYGNTPLHIAASRGHLSMVRWLLDSGADVNSKNAGGVTPLKYAMQGKHSEIVEILVSSGAKVDGCMIS